MAKKNEPEVTEQKVQTRYDKKMAARKAKEERDRISASWNLIIIIIPL